MAHPTFASFQDKRRQQEALSRRLLAHVRAGQALQGFAIQHVQGSDGCPDFAYTIGLYERGYPELLISGLSAQTRVHWLLDLGFRMVGPPPLKTRLKGYACTLLARVQGQRVTWPSFPPGGQKIQAGIRYSDLAEDGYPTIFANVAPAFYHTHLSLAMRYYGHRDFPVLQVVWPDVAERFPWDERSHTCQQCFFDQRHLIALLAAHAPYNRIYPPVRTPTL